MPAFTIPSFSLAENNADGIRTILLMACLAFGILIVMYPNRPIGVKSRSGIKAIGPAYPLVGNLPWILSIIRQKTRLLDEVYRIQTEEVGNGQPFTITFPALGGRVTVINSPAYLQHVQKVSTMFGLRISSDIISCAGQL